MNFKGLFKIYVLFSVAHMYEGTVYACEYRCLSEPTQVVRRPGAGVTGDHEPPGRNAGDRTQVL